MPIHAFMVLASFSLLGFSLLLLGFLLRNKIMSFIGKPTISRIYFYTGKIALFTCWTLFLLKAIFPKMGYMNTPPALSWIAVIILGLGCIIMIFSFFSLGVSLKVGLPDEATELKTGGLYRFSRNPLYLGVFMINIASCLYFPDLVNIACSIYSIVIHHMITRGEEQFLENRFGESWKVYKRRVRRYL